jgi:hypothetical protein
VRLFGGPMELLIIGLQKYDVIIKNRSNKEKVQEIQKIVIDLNYK